MKRKIDNNANNNDRVVKKIKKTEDDIWYHNIQKYLEPFDIMMMSWTCKSFVNMKNSHYMKTQIKKIIHDFPLKTKECFFELYRPVSIFSIIYAGINTCSLCKKSLKNGLFDSNYCIYAHATCMSKYMHFYYYDGRNILKQIKQPINNKPGMFVYGPIVKDIVMGGTNIPNLISQIIKNKDHILYELEGFHVLEEETLNLHLDFMELFYYNRFLTSINKQFVIFLNGVQYKLVSIYQYYLMNKFADERYDDKIKYTIRAMNRIRDSVVSFFNKCSQYHDIHRSNLHDITNNKSWDRICDITPSNFIKKTGNLRMYTFEALYKKSIANQNEKYFLESINSELELERLKRCECRICKLMLFIPDCKNSDIFFENINYETITYTRLCEIFKDTVTLWCNIWDVLHETFNNRIILSKIFRYRNGIFKKIIYNILSNDIEIFTVRIKNIKSLLEEYTLREILFVFKYKKYKLERRSEYNSFKIALDVRRQDDDGKECLCGKKLRDTEIIKHCNECCLNMSCPFHNAMIYDVDDDISSITTDTDDDDDSDWNEFI